MTDQTHENAHAHEHADHKVVPLSILIMVFASLLVLTIITYAVTFVDLGELNLFVALAIAVIKGSLVCLFFMHLWWDSPVNSLALVAALGFVALFLGLSILDAGQYKPVVDQYKTDHPVKIEPPAGHAEAEAAPEQGASEEGESGEGAQDGEASDPQGQEAAPQEPGDPNGADAAARGESPIGPGRAVAVAR